MGWRAAGDAPLSSPWPAPVVALPELLPCRAGWKTSSPGKLRQQLGGGWKKQILVGFQGSAVSPDPSASQCSVQGALGCAICQNPWLCLASKASVARPSSLETC